MSTSPPLLLAAIVLVAGAPGRSQATEDTHASVSLRPLVPTSASPATSPRPRQAAWPDPASGMSTGDYTMRAVVRNDHRTIDGEATVRWTNGSRAAVRDAWWHLYLNGFRDGRTLFMRSGGAEGHRGHDRGEYGRIEVLSMQTAAGDDLLAASRASATRPDDSSELYTPLPRAVAPGESVEFRVRWRATLPSAFARTGYWRDFAFCAQWFPKLAALEVDGQWAHFPFHANSEFFADFGRYDVTLVVPRGDVVGATGRRVEGPLADRDGERHRFVQERVHDFAFTSWSRYREHTRSIDGVGVRVLHPPGTDGLAARTIAVLDAAIPAFRRRFGPYPYPTLTVVIPPRGARGAGGMEYPTLITTGGAVWEPPGVHDVDYVTIHEFGHQYFYGIVASNESRWPFLDEGLTEFATGVVLEDLQHRDASLVDTRWLRLGFWAFQTTGATWEPSSRPISLAARDYPSFRSYGQHVYRRTAAVLHTFENTWGRSILMRALRRYVDTNRFRHPTPDDLVASFFGIADDHAIDDYLRPALFADATVDYSVLSVTSGRAGAVTVAWRGRPRVPVEVEYEFDDGGHRRQIWTPRASRETLPIAGTSAVRAVRIDPDHRVTLDFNSLDNARLVEGRRASNVAAALRWMAWTGTLLRGLGP